VTEPRPPDYPALLKRSLLAIDQLEAKLAAVERARSEPIAIIGIGCRFAGGIRNLDSFWNVLAAGTDVATEVPRERWDADQYFDPNPDAVGKAYTKQGYFVTGDVDQFDAPFFGISRREALSLDPQQRMLLEVVWEALEDAGIAPASLMGSQTAVFTGISSLDYVLHLTSGDREQAADAYTASGTAHSMASGRISYALGLQGPNVAVDTACSSSLVAVHLAVQSLRNKEANLALASGVNLILVPDGTVMLCRARMMSIEGRCKTFDASADGYARGEGCGVVVLKRLADAQRDGDRILAVIRGTALNQDGRTSGVTAPNGPAQEAVIRAALANAGLKPADISYIEAHGTGTSLGDPIEIKALGEVFGAQHAEQPLMVGSVKTNLGHGEAAAGVAGLIKAVLALRHRTIPPHLHLTRPNPLIAWDRYPIVVPTELTPWSSPAGKPRRAGVSSFGFSGTNSHVILEEAPESARQTAIAAQGPQLLALSAENPEALRQLAERYQAYLTRDDAPALSDIARSAIVGRSHFAERVAVVASTAEEAAGRLAEFVRGNMAAGAAQGRTSGGTIPEIAFLFTGQGSQYAGMGLQLYATQPAFRASLEQCARVLDPLLGTSLLELISGTRPGLDDTRFTQPALFAMEYALAQLWKAWGVEPSVVMGHSVGEYVAACIAGVFSLEDGLRLIAERGRLMSALPAGGAMAAVFCDGSRARSVLAAAPNKVDIAGTNGPQNTVLSGSVEAIEWVRSRLAAQGIESQRLNVSHAFHSHLMDPMLDAFEAFASQMRFSPPRIALVSNVTGQMAGADIATAAYWRQHIRHAVHFSDSVATLQSEGIRVCLEVGPHPTLLGMVQRCASTGGLSLIPSLRRARDETVCMLEGMGQLYVRGVPVVATGVWGPGAGHDRVPLPGYPFQRERYWREVVARSSSAGLSGTRTGHPLLGSALSSAMPLFQQQVSADQPGWLANHRVGDHAQFPPTGFLELALAAGREVLGVDRCRVRDFRVLAPMVVRDATSLTLQVAVTPAADGAHQVQIFSRAGTASSQPWQAHATAVVARFISESPNRVDLAALRTPCSEAVDLTAAPAVFQGVKQLWRGERQALASVEIAAEDATKYLLHPLLLDACLQTCGAAGASEPSSVHTQRRYVPRLVSELQLCQPGSQRVWVHAAARVAKGAGAALTADFVVLTEAGDVIAVAENVECERSDPTSILLEVARSSNDLLYELDWQPSSRAAANEPAVSDTWLVLADDNGVADGLITRLSARGDRCIAVPYSAAVDFDSLLEQKPTRILHLWSLAHDADGAPTAASLREAHHRNCRSLLELVQAIARNHSNGSPQLSVVTRGAVVAGGATADVSLLGAPLVGLARVVALEHPQLKCRVIDVDTPQADPDSLCAELVHPDRENFVALRGGARLAARLVHSKRARRSVSPALQGTTDTAIVPHATYLISGGLGGLGLEVARAFVAAGARNLVLLGRRAPSERARKALEDLTLAGAHVRVEAVDVADRAALERVFASIAATLPPLGGIVHAAGVLDDGVLIQQSWDRFERVFRPKIDGAWHLHELSAHLALRFFVLFSSAAALLGSPGQGNYTAANAFLDALAHHRRASGRAAVSIAWGPWRETGMASAGDIRQQQRFSRQGVTMLAPATALSVLRELLGDAPPNVGVLEMNWAKVVAQYERGLAPPLLDTVADGSKQASGNATSLLDQLRAAGDNPSEEQLLAYVRECVAAVLDTPPERVALDVPLLRLGLDSLMAVEVRNRIERAIGSALPLARYIDGSDVTALTRALLEHVRARTESAVTADALALLDLVPDMSDAEVEAHLARLTQGAMQ
jgi:acyl transferase domain-containing protein